MKYDIYGKFQIQIERDGNMWRAFKIGNGLRMPLHDLIIPSELSHEDLLTFLDDFYHEAAAPDTAVREI